MIVAEERFAALAGPLDGPADAVRRPGEQGPFGIEKVARAETAAHLFAEDAHPLCRHAQRMGEVKPGLGNAAAGPTIECVLFAFGIECRHSRARLERDAGHALHPGIETHDVGGTCEGGGCSCGVPCLDIDAQVVGRLIPQCRRARLDRVDRAADRRQRLVCRCGPVRP